MNEKSIPVLEDKVILLSKYCQPAVTHLNSFVSMNLSDIVGFVYGNNQPLIGYAENDILNCINQYYPLDDCKIIFFRIGVQRPHLGILPENLQYLNLGEFQTKEDAELGLFKGLSNYVKLYCAQHYPGMKSFNFMWCQVYVPSPKSPCCLMPIGSLVEIKDPEIIGKKSAQSL